MTDGIKKCWKDPELYLNWSLHTDLFMGLLRKDLGARRDILAIIPSATMKLG